MSFKNLTIVFILFTVVCLLVFLIWFLLKRKQLKFASGLFGSQALREKFLLNFHYQRFLASVILVFLTAGALLFCLFDPAWGKRERNMFVENLDILFVVDVSNSMNATDVAPTRLERSKQAIRTILSQLGNQRVGIMAFARSAFFYCPFTADYTSFLEFLQALSSENIPDQGTEVDDLFEKTEKMLKNQQATAKVVIFISDGEIHQDLPAKSFTDDLGQPVQSFVLGVGTKAGANISIQYQGYFSTSSKDFQTKLDDEKLTDLAKKLSADYYDISNSLQGALAIANKMQGGQKTLLGQKHSTSLISRAHIFVLLPLLTWFLAMGFQYWRPREKSQSL